MARVIAIANQKGGVGKTTTTISLGAGLRELGNRVLLVDMDPQGALSIALGVDDVEQSMYDVLCNANLSVESIVVATAIGCDLAPSNIHLAGAEVELISEPGREFILKSKLTAIDGNYDYILSDCPPSLGLLTLNAITAAAEVLIPVQSQYLAFRGMELLMATIDKVKARVNPNLEILGILATFYNGHTRHAREVVGQLRAYHGHKVFSVPIPATIKFADTTTAGESILTFSKSSPAADAYRELAREVHNARTN
ncbi:MAG: ParA family protein [Deltaproteobacteria bacterium]|nr:ParA family protein [Deltaproteobacteria bacterium]